MEVKFWTCVLLVQVHLVIQVKGQKSTHQQTRPDDSTSKAEAKDYEHKPLDFLVNHHKNPTNDYFLPPVYNPNEENDEDEEDDSTYVDYYEAKEINYKDSPEATPRSDKQDVLNLDDKIPLHSTKDNLPIFLLEPENTYVVKNKPATLKCRVANALEVYFKCNGIKTQALNFEFVDPQTGVRIIEGEYKVTRENFDEYFGDEKYQCSCFAWTSGGHIRSQPATIELAFIKKQFSVAPETQLVKQYSPVTFRCEPPPAAPYARVYWLKNGAPIVTDDNVQVSKHGDLYIKKVSLLDMANYTCVAENLAGKRISDPAQLKVVVNGGWTTWSAWSDCYCGQRERSGRRRERSCTAPPPLHGGLPCVGPEEQKTQDCIDCDIDMYVDGIDGLADESTGISLDRWSQWSEWSPCDSDCLQSRRRRCLSSSRKPCVDADYQVVQCPMCVRTSKSALIHDGSSYWPLLIALSIAFLILIVVVILGIKYMKFKMAENSPYVKPPSGTNYFGNVIRRTLTNQPDLTIHEEFHTMDSRRTRRQMSTSTNARNEHLYEVPQLANSYMSPIDHEVRNQAEGDRNFACKDSVELDRSDSSCFLSSGSSYGNESVEMSGSLRNNASVDSKLLNPQHLETATSRIVSGDGGWLNLDKCGASLFVPDGLVDKEELFSIEVTDEEWNRPVLREGETQLSPVIRCGPKNFHFSKGVILTFPHCAALKHTSWLLSILQKPEDINSKEWRKVLTLGQETPGTPIFAQVDPSKVFLVSEFLSDFVLVGQSFSGLDAKLLKIAMFISKRMDDNYFSLKVHVMNDTPYAFHECLENERRVGGTLLCEPKIVYFQESCSDVCINIREVGEGWRIQSGGKYQELPYSQIWNMSVRSVHCIFVLQQTDSINCLELNMNVYQKQKQSNSVNFNFKTNDLNSNLNFNKRFSYSGVSVGGTVTIVENPFNYSSLSKKENRYNFVFKNDSIYRSNFSTDNNYRTNALTKSDRVILCKLLDSQTSKGNDWRLLAEKLKITSYYYYFSNTCSPTENILNLWLCRNNDVNMLVQLSRIFREMSRIDCATVVERRCFPN
ncbi:netrin receptor UNC5B-like [Amyelois transitella]|uniref:netrin receptor UNC5B-like n=1 Tax=Amyelois transitella TaxID=680683 RepID=UPI00298F5974|nr:netrin receptor UNC5B-like [Amyelois transitella]